MLDGKWSMAIDAKNYEEVLLQTLLMKKKTILNNILTKNLKLKAYKIQLTQDHQHQLDHQSRLSIGLYKKLRGK